MIQSYSASLNSLGNPRIYGSNTQAFAINNTILNTLYNRFVIEQLTTGIEIYITPNTTEIVDAAFTNAYNSFAITSIFTYLGLTCVFQNNRFEITGNLILNNEYDTTSTGSDTINAVQANMVSTLNFHASNGSILETQYFAVSVNHSNFFISQLSCSDCLEFTYLDADYDYQNPLDNYGLADRGIVDYQYQNSSGTWVSMGTSKVESLNTQYWSEVNKTAILQYCFCDQIINLPIRGVRTVREVPNCGGVSPVIYQSISRYFRSFLPSSNQQTLMTTIPYIPSVQYDSSFACCVSEDSEIEVTPLTLTPNRDTPHTTGIANALKYDLYINNEGVYDYIPQTSVKTGEIVVTEDSTAVLGVLTTFLTELTVGSILYDNTGIKLGVVASITNNLNLVLESVALDSYSGEYRSQTFYFINPTLSSIFTYNDIIKGTYKLVATYNNACTSVSKEWIISICNATIVNTGTCNNPSIQNLSAINSAKFTIKTSNSLDIVDSVSQKVILKDQIVSPLSTYQVPKLDDGFYQLDVQTLNSDGEIISTETQLLFYDCNIKSCEVYLRSNLLGFSNCVDCVDKKANQKEYETLKLKNDMFQIYKDIIYSYWNNIKKQQSIDETWDIEDHLQEVTTYSNALKQINTICTDCGFSFDTNTGTLSSGDCGCNG